MTRPEARPVLETAHASPVEERARARLEAMFAARDLAPWFHARRLLIDEEERVASCCRVDGGFLIRWRPFGDVEERRPQLDIFLLAVYIHEQLHAYLGGQPGLDAALDEVRAWYPQVPDREHGGARSEFSTRLHLLLCTLELDGLAHFIGKEAARLHLSRVRGYRWIYGEVLAHTERFRELNRRCGLGIHPN